MYAGSPFHNAFAVCVRASQPACRGYLLFVFAVEQHTNRRRYCVYFECFAYCEIEAKNLSKKISGKKYAFETNGFKNSMQASSPPLPLSRSSARQRTECRMPFIWYLFMNRMFVKQSKPLAIIPRERALPTHTHAHRGRKFHSKAF